MLKSTYKFPILASQDSEEIEWGVPLELHCQSDDTEIGVFLDSLQIGRIPNSGMTCSICLGKIREGKCENGHTNANAVPGGLAYRLLKEGLFERDFSCIAVGRERGILFAELNITI